jgi:pimeloyl-ACP methyl ester carboxylesterase
LDFGGDQSRDILLLHGLAGRGSEWENTAEWLTQYGHVIALDQRGHGASREGVSDFSRKAYVRDVIHTIEQYCRSPVILIGQSMGGLNAFLAAAERPDLVKLLIVVEGTPEPNPGSKEQIRNWLERWPVPFRSKEEAKKFFGGDSLYAQTFAKSLEKLEDGYWPAFNNEDMIRSMDDVVSLNYWNDWRKITCPTLIVGGEKSFISQDLLKKMAKMIPVGRYTCISQAGHDVHLEAPYEWRSAVEKFIKEIL